MAVPMNEISQNARVPVSRAIEQTHDRDLEADFRGVEVIGAARRRLRLVVEASRSPSGCLPPAAARPRPSSSSLPPPRAPVRADQLRELRVGRVHVVAAVLRLVIRPAVGRLRLQHDLLGVQAMAHQRDDRQQRRDDGHREADQALARPSARVPRFPTAPGLHGHAREYRRILARAPRTEHAILRVTVDLRQLEILQAIAETGSFTACGRKLHVSQSAISRQILLLEEELGEPLFLRVGRQVRMTPAAESLVQLGQRVFLDVRETVGTITDRTRELRGTLRLSGGMTVCLYVFPPLLKHLRRVHPQLDVRLTVATGGAVGAGDPRAAASTPGC